jgi:hypothetical protein
MSYRTSAVEYLSQSKQLIDERFPPTDAPSPPATLHREVPAKSSSADRNLLFRILALQLNFISREQLIAAMNA